MKTSLLLLALFVGQPAPKTDLRFPAQLSIPQATTKLSGSDLYVIDADIAVIVTSSPLGLVKITQQAGPLTVRAKFVDSVGPELRTYKGKFVFLVEAAKTGPCELLVIPSGATKESEIIRKTIDVDAGQSPQPPPGPGPSPKPTPPPLTAPLKHVTFIGAELNAAALAVNNDAGLRTLLKNAGVGVHVLKASDPMIVTKGLQASVNKAGGSPCVIAQDELGNVLGQVRMTSVSDVTTFCTKYIRR